MLALMLVIMRALSVMLALMLALMLAIMRALTSQVCRCAFLVLEVCVGMGAKYRPLEWLL